MFLLFIRTSVLALLIGGSVAVVPEGGASCPQKISAELIRELWSHTRQLIARLPVRPITTDQKLTDLIFHLPINVLLLKIDND